MFKTLYRRMTIQLHHGIIIERRAFRIYVCWPHYQNRSLKWNYSTKILSLYNGQYLMLWSIINMCYFYCYLSLKYIHRYKCTSIWKYLSLIKNIVKQVSQYLPPYHLCNTETNLDHFNNITLRTIHFSGKFN